MPVSRETGPPPREVVSALFPGQEAEIYRYVDLLIHRGVDRGLLGPREVPRLWERHIVNCAVIRELFPAGAAVVDVGSGAGLPGIVLALSRVDLQLTLVEPLLRRTRFLTEVADDLGLTRVEIVRARAEDLAGDRSFDVATARAVAPLSRLVPWALPLCREGGEFVALKGESASEEVEAAGKVLQRCQARDVRIEQYGAGLVQPLTTVVRIGSNGHVPRQSRHRKGGG